MNYSYVIFYNHYLGLCVREENETTFESSKWVIEDLKDAIMTHDFNSSAEKRSFNWLKEKHPECLL